MSTLTLSTPVLIHLGFALVALVLGPIALLARKGTPGHRLAGYVWVAVMLGAAISSLFLHDYRRPNIAGYTVIHLVTLLTFAGVGRGVWLVMQRRIREHRKMMWGTYVGGCLVAGSFALAPHRLLGQLVWHSALGWT
jgi:uncharacterized membrane protein